MSTTTTERRASASATFLRQTPSVGREPRTLFISDLHLGRRDAQVERLAACLDAVNPEYLYLVGDIVDGDALRRRWHWPKIYNHLLNRFHQLVQDGTQVVYLPGNHDAFVAHFPGLVHGVRVEQSVVHLTADGRRLYVTHGDQYDGRREATLGARIAYRAADFGYDGLLRVGEIVQAVTGRPARTSALSWLKRRLPAARRFVAAFENTVSRYAREHEYDGVVCGHIHTPRLTVDRGFTYANTGDWLENRTMLIESNEGSLHLVDDSGVVHAAAEATREVEVEPALELCYA